MKFVALAVDLHPDYLFLAPITARVWQKVVGYAPIVIAVGSEAGWDTPHGALVARELFDDCTVDHVPVPDGYLSSTAAQLSRLYAAAYPGIDDNDYIVTSDIDMWPVNGPWFHRGEPLVGGFGLYYANNPTRYPICYVGAHAGTWREAYGKGMDATCTDGIRTGRRWANAANGGHRIADHVEEHLRTHLSPSTSPLDAWQHDEEWLTSKVHAWPGYPNQCSFLHRAAGEPPNDRIDRGAWPGAEAIAQMSMAEIIDAHLPRPGQSHWPALRALLSRIAPDLVGWAEAYHDTYTRTPS